MCSIVAIFVNRVKHDTSGVALHLQPVIEKRLETMKELGLGWNDKPVGNRWKLI